MWVIDTVEITLNFCRTVGDGRQYLHIINYQYLGNICAFLKIKQKNISLWCNSVYDQGVVLLLRS